LRRGRSGSDARSAPHQCPTRCAHGYCRRYRHDRATARRASNRRAQAAGIFAPIGNHSFRATGITAYLSKGGALVHAQSMAAHESPRTTKRYDRTKERLTQDEVERIRL
jgi:site-specific recombinase XerD